MSSFQEGKALYIEAFHTLTSVNNFAGNGFTVKVDSEFFLITNRHNLETKDYYTKVSHFDSSLNYIRCMCLCIKNYEIIPRQIRSEENELFYGNSYKSKQTDIVGVYLDKVGNDSNLIAINYETNYRLKKGDEVFSISTLGVNGTAHSFFTFAKIISDPNQDNDSEFGTLPIVLLDKISVPGMSGSPVFVWPNKNKNPILVGVLSGNVNNGNNAFFWRKDIILDLVKNIRSARAITAK